MNPRVEYSKLAERTDIDDFIKAVSNDSYLYELHKYILFLENKVSDPQILTWIKTMFEHAEKKQWFETYWGFDIHGTISRPDYRKGLKRDENDPIKVIYYPFAKETLQLLTKRTDIILFSFTSSYPEELNQYIKVFEEDDIHFDYHNENPEVSSAKGSFGYYEKKPYFNVLFEDKTGFNPETDWEPIYRYFLETKYRPNPTWSMKHKEDYHKE